MKRVFVLIGLILFSQTVFAQNTSRYFAGDYKYTPSEFTINANTANGSDTGRMNITGGGGTGTGTTRGGYVSVYGADRGGAGAGGDVQLVTADDGDILLNAHGSGYIDFRTVNEQKWFIAPTATTFSELYFGILGTPNWEAHVLASSNDGSDSGRLSLSGGGAIGTTRGGRIDLYGADRGGAGAGGDVNIYTADNGDILLNSAGTGSIIVDASGASGYIDFNTNGHQRWFIAPTAAAYADLYFGELGVANFEAHILNSSNDGSDSGRLTLTGGGAVGDTRGGRIDLYGADRGGAGAGGDIILNTADSGDIILNSKAASTIFKFASDTKFTVFPAAASNSILTFGDGTANWTAQISDSTADGSDSGRLTLTGGGAIGSTRGGRIDLYGADRGGAGAGGDVAIVTADDGDLTLTTAGGSGYIDFVPNNQQTWFIAPSAAAKSELYYGILGTGNWEASITNSANDGSDSGRLNLGGGGAIGTTRGGYISLYGADRGGAGNGGDIELITADAGDLTLDASGAATIIMKTSNTTRWTINSDGTLDASVTDIGWVTPNAPNQACATTCGANKGCVVGFDTATLTFVPCTAGASGAADTCICTK